MYSLNVFLHPLQVNSWLEEDPIVFFEVATLVHNLLDLLLDWEWTADLVTVLEENPLLMAEFLFRFLRDEERKDDDEMFGVWFLFILNWKQLKLYVVSI